MSEDNKESATTKAQVQLKSKTKSPGIKSRERVRDAGEVFTGRREVVAMCDLCEPTISEIDKKVLEPSCGNGNFLVEVLDRKLKKAGQDHYKALIALSNIYGIDIAVDNLEEARERMKLVILDHFQDERTPASFLMAVDTILKANICFGNMLTGRKKINLINWIPDGAEGFEMEQWNFEEIEKRRANTKHALKVEDIPNTYQSIVLPKTLLKKAKPKPKPKVKEQKSLF